MTTLTFHNATLKTIKCNNKIWLPSKKLAKALEYSDPKRVTVLYDRNKHEFTNEMTEVLILSTPRNLIRKTRIFSLRGAHLIAMFARTPVAEQFRKWVLDLIDKEVNQTSQVKQSSTIIAPNREVLPKGIYHAQSKYNPYRTTAWNAELKRWLR